MLLLDSRGVSTNNPAMAFRAPSKFVDAVAALKSRGLLHIEVDSSGVPDPAAAATQPAVIWDNATNIDFDSLPAEVSLNHFARSGEFGHKVCPCAVTHVKSTRNLLCWAALQGLLCQNLRNLNEATVTGGDAGMPRTWLLSHPGELVFFISMMFYKLLHMVEGLASRVLSMFRRHVRIRGRCVATARRFGC